MFLQVIYNRETDRSRGFGFVTMSTVEEAEKAAVLYNRYVSYIRYFSLMDLWLWFIILIELMKSILRQKNIYVGLLNFAVKSWT